MQSLLSVTKRRISEVLSLSTHQAAGKTISCSEFPSIASVMALTLTFADQVVSGESKVIQNPFSFCPEQRLPIFAELCLRGEIVKILSDGLLSAGGKTNLFSEAAPQTSVHEEEEKYRTCSSRYTWIDMYCPLVHLENVM